jgi:hypothetical protein
MNVQRLKQLAGIGENPQFMSMPNPRQEFARRHHEKMKLSMKAPVTQPVVQDNTKLVDSFKKQNTKPMLTQFDWNTISERISK